MRSLGVDVGDKRMGIALSDASGSIASPTDTIERKGQDKDIDRLLELARRQEVDTIVVGLPLSMDGSIGPQAKKVGRFVHALRTKSTIPVMTWDERLTTVGAERALIEGNVSRLKRKKVIDKVAAALILQGYLDSQRR